MQTAVLHFDLLCPRTGSLMALLRIALILLLILRFPVASVAQETPPKDRFARIEPEAAGFSSAKLTELASYLDEAGSSSLMLVHDGKVFFEWGDIYEKHTIHSIRKALLNSLYGIYVDRGIIDTSATLAALEIDDIAPHLTDTERTARVADLLKSRSGIYHPAAAVSASMASSAPERRSHRPGEAFYYNNWDFNVLGAIFEEQTGRTIFEAFRNEVAEPLGMRQYRGTHTTIDGSDPDSKIPNTDGFYQYERDASQYPAYHFRLSAHDLALYGSLYLNRGQWRGRQLLPESWIDASTQAYSVTNPRVGIGYGLLWNVLMETETRSTASFFHTGAGVHMLGVYPASKLVLVHRVDTERETDFTPDRLYRIISLVFEAKLSS